MPIDLIIQLISGALGGNAAAAANKNGNMGWIMNTVLGLIGGGVGGQWLGPLLGLAKSGVDISSIIQQVLSGGVGGGALMAIAAVVKGMMANKG
jgi:uncharacterized membrane protein YeaQ/YmgE (transglycosylase-associated protein family)